MKFTYDEKQDRGECVAYLDGDFLTIKDTDGVVVCLSKLGIGHHPSWSPAGATRRFYPGDKITIEF